MSTNERSWCQQKSDDDDKQHIDEQQNKMIMSTNVRWWCQKSKIRW